MKKTYKVFFKWLDDGFEDTFNCTGLKELKLNVEAIRNNPNQKLLEVQRQMPNGEFLTKNI